MFTVASKLPRKRNVNIYFTYEFYRLSNYSFVCWFHCDLICSSWKIPLYWSVTMSIIAPLRVSRKRFIACWNKEHVVTLTFCFAFNSWSWRVNYSWRTLQCTVDRTSCSLNKNIVANVTNIQNFKKVLPIIPSVCTSTFPRCISFSTRSEKGHVGHVGYICWSRFYLKCHARRRRGAALGLGENGFDFEYLLCRIPETVVCSIRFGLGPPGWVAGGPIG